MLSTLSPSHPAPSFPLAPQEVRWLKAQEEALQWERALMASRLESTEQVLSTRQQVTMRKGGGEGGRKEREQAGPRPSVGVCIRDVTL